MIVEGINVVRELLNSGTKVNKIIVEENPSNELLILLDMARAKSVEIEFATKQTLEKLVGKNQGILAKIPPYKFCEVEDILSHAQKQNQPAFILILDGVVDPHNLGAIIRTAECAGVHGVIIPQNRSADITDTVYKTSAGAVAHIKVAKVVNLTQTIKNLQDAGVWVYALEAGGKNIYDTDLTYPTALVVGSEGKGVSQLVKKTADEVVSLDMFGKVNSLNASNAAAIATYEVVRQRRNKKGGRN